MFAFTNLNISYQNHILIKNGNITLKPGYLTVLMGLSGSGKTTLLNYIANSNLKSKPSILYLKQFDNFFENMTCLNNLLFTCNLYGTTISKKRIKDAKKQVGLHVDLNAYPNSLSQGERQRLTIMLSLLIDCDIYLFDEITASLDTQGRNEIAIILKSLAKRKQCAVLVSTHDENLGALGDIIYQIHGQEIHCLKDEAEIKDVQLPKERTTKKMPLAKKFYQYRFKKKMLYHLLCYLLNGCIAACLVFGILYFKQTEKQIQLVVDRIPENQVLVFHNFSSENKFYSANAIPFDDHLIEQLTSLEPIGIYPFFQWECYDFWEERPKEKRMPIITFSQKNNDSDWQEIVFDSNLGMSVVPVIYPYYPEQHYETLALHTFKTKQEGTPCYISEYLASELNFDFKNTNSYQLKITAYVPDKIKSVATSEKEINGVITEVDTISYDYRPLELFLDVQGVLATQTANYTNLDELYLPYDFMQNEMSDTLLSSSNAYMVFNDDLKHLTESLSSISDTIGFSSTQTMYREGIEQRLTSQNSLIKGLMIGGIITMLLALVINSYLYEKGFKKERVLLKARQLEIKQIKSLVLGEIIFGSLITSCYACVLFEVFFMIGRNQQYLYNHDYLGFGFILCLLLCLAMEAAGHLFSLMYKENK